MLFLKPVPTSRVNICWNTGTIVNRHVSNVVSLEDCLEITKPLQICFWNNTQSTVKYKHSLIVYDIFHQNTSKIQFRAFQSQELIIYLGFHVSMADTELFITTEICF